MWLLENKAIPLKEQNIKDKYGNTALHFTVMAQFPTEHKEFALSQLLDAGANPHIVNSSNIRPLQCVFPGEQNLRRHLITAEKSE